MMTDTDDDAFLTLPSIYDGEDGEEEDLWFLPPEDGGEEQASEFLFDISGWLEAERTHTADLTEIGFHLGLLSQKSDTFGSGLRDRLIRKEVVEMSWSAGDRMPLDILHKSLSLGSVPVSKRMRSYRHVEWAHRTLMRRPNPSHQDIRDILERRRANISNASDPIGKPTGQAFDDALEEWKEVMDAARSLTPVTRACLSFFTWEAVEISGQDAVYEAAVLAMLIGNLNTRNSLGFLPVASGGGRPFNRAGTIEQRLATWIHSSANAVLRLLMEVESLEIWHQEALSFARRTRGQTATSVVNLFLQYPVVSTDLITQRLDVSLSTATRLMARFESAGMIREITQQSMFRMWEAQI